MPTLDIDEIMNIKILENGKNVSGGQKRMIAIARALLKKPSLLILDEPTTFLDNKTKEILKNTIINLNNMMVLVVTHDNYFDSFISKKIVLHD